MKTETQPFETRQYMHRDDFEIFHYRQPKLDGVALHHHDFFEVYCFLGGNVEYCVEGKTYSLQKGDLLLINPMEFHQPLVRPSRENYERIVLWVNREYLSSLETGQIRLTQCFDINRENLLRPTATQARHLYVLLKELLVEHRSNDFGGDICAKGLFLQLMVELNRLSIRAGEESERNLPLAAQVVSYINQRYRQTLSLDSLAEEFYVSKYHLSHVFTAATGVSVYRYIILKRLQAARQLLMDGKPPKEAFLHSGFGDYANFYRAFLKEYGVTPHVFASGLEHRHAPALASSPSPHEPTAKNSAV